MKTEKLSLTGIKNVLSRAEMKKIMAGSGNPTCAQGGGCPSPYNPGSLPCCHGCFPVGQFGSICQ